MSLRSWRTRVRCAADCLTCGEVGNDEDPDLRERALRWARRHAEENPGHLVAVETTDSRCYRVQP